MAMATAPGVRFLPNAITVLAFCAGLSSVNFAFHREFLLSVAMIATAAVLDALDGPAARILNSTSRIGAELDSLSDCVSFGVAPALVLFLWELQNHPIGWAICLIYAVCCTLRLARFNSALDDDDPPPWSKLFFTGVPSPAGALLAIIPLILYTRFDNGWWTNQWLVAIWLVFVGVLMISRIPTIALKNVFIPSKLVLPSLVGLVLTVALAFYQPQIMVTLGLLVYLAHLPYAAWKRRRVQAHPELFEDPKYRRARARARRNHRLRPRMPVRRVAGRARDGKRLPSYRGLLRPGSENERPPTTRPLGRRRLR